MKRAATFFLALTLTACHGRAVVGGRTDATVTPEDAATDAPFDAAFTDASLPDAGGDTSVATDAATDALLADSDALDDAHASDATTTDGSAFAADAGSTDAGLLDATLLDATVMDASMADSSAIGSPCTHDNQCTAGEQWCESGVCVVCDNSFVTRPHTCPVCLLGTSRYVRNGCAPCECVPTNECLRSADCDPGVSGRSPQCYAGAACPDWCPAGDPRCCYGGNRCDFVGCTGSHPAGCSVTGCPYGYGCSFAAYTCGRSACTCAESGTFDCTDDCSGGECVPLM